MEVFIKLYQVIGQLYNMSFNIYGYDITFMQIFAFIMIAGVCAIFIRNLLS